MKYSTGHFIKMIILGSLRYNVIFKTKKKRSPPQKKSATEVARPIDIKISSEERRSRFSFHFVK